MSEFVPYIVFGLIAGSVYGISAMGLVLTYKTSGVFNIGHGAVCAAAAYVFYSLRQVHHLPWPVAAVIVLGVFAPIAGLVLERLAVVLAPVPTSFRIVGTVGLLVAIQSSITLIYGGQGLVFTPFLPQGKAFSLPGVDVSIDQTLTFLFGAAAAVALALFFRKTRLGTAMRGVVDDPQLLDMTGENPARVRRSAWIIGSVFACASGVLFASSEQQLDVIVLSLLVVQAFGAATLARFSSLPMCFVGGLIVGLLQKLLSKEIGGGHANLQGLDLSMPFLVLFIGLLVIPRKQLVEVGRQVKARAAPQSSLSLSQRRAGVGVLLGAALFVPAFAGSHIPAWNVAMVQVVLFVSLHLLVRTSGQISLCHVGFAAVGAAGFGHMLQDGVPFALAVLIGGLVCIPLALVVSVPAIRLSGLYLGLATLGLGILLTQYAYGKSYMFGFGSLKARRPGVLDLTDDQHYYYALLAVAVLAVALVLLIERSRLGRLLRGVADAPVALSTLGLSVSVSRVLVFCISGFLAGISGAMYASLFGAVNQDSFNFVQSLVVLAVLSISGRRTLTAAVVAPLLLYVVPNYIDDADTVTTLQIGFGLAAMLAAANSQGALAQAFASTAARFTDRLEGPATVRLREAARTGPPRYTTRAGAARRPARPAA